jgi:metal-dependent amidase/aminoacylase/carboxypeptidase family protein
MEKTFSKIEISVIKSTAKNAAQFVAKKQKVEAQIKEVEEKVAEQIKKRVEKLEAEKAGYQAIIDSLNTPVKQITGGYTTEDLVDIKKEGTGSLDSKTGKEIMKTVYVLKYPDTVIPPTTEDVPGSDYDADVENTQHEVAQEEVIEELVAADAQAHEEAEANTDPFSEEGW